MGKKRANRNLRASWNFDSLMSRDSLDQNMDDSVPESGEASIRSQNDIDACATPSKSPPGKKKKADSAVSLTEIFDAIQSLNSKQDAFFQKITRIESSIDVTTAAENSLSDTVNRLLSDVATQGEKIGKAEASIQHMQQENVSLMSRVEELERYSRRWCLKLLGVKEREEENVRTITINLARVVPRIKDKLEEAVDAQ